MKTTILTKLAAAAAFVGLLSACDVNKYPVFDDSDAFAAFDVTGYSCREDAGTIRIPVTIASVNPVATSVTYEVVPGTAKQGDNYKLVDESGVLIFDGTERTKYIEFEIVNVPGKYLGTLTFTVNLLSASDLDLSLESSCTVSISDLDHPLSALAGTYTATGYDQTIGSAQAPTSWTVTLTTSDEDVTIVYVTGFNTLSANNGITTLGNVETDADGNFVIRMPYGYNTGVEANDGYLLFCSCRYEGGYYVGTSGEAVLTQVSDAPLTFYTEDSFGLVDNAYIYNGGFVLPGGVTWVKND